MAPAATLAAMNGRARTRLLGLAGVCAALALPVLLVARLVGATAEPGKALSAGLLERRLMLAQAAPDAPLPGADPGAAGPAHLVSGVLYTRGTATVTWNGVSFPVRDGSYAYSGGERIAVGPQAIGLLRLADGSTVILCSGAEAVLTRGDGGAWRLELTRGSSRFAFRAGSVFSVRAGATEIRPWVRDPAAGVFEGEVKRYADGGCLVCELRRGVTVVAGRASDSGAGVPPGRVLEVTPPAPGSSADAYRVSSTPIPQPLMLAALGPGGADGEPAGAYLCRCEDLKRGLERPEDAEPALVTAEPEAPAPQVVTEGTAEIVPPVAPPDAPPVALAEPGPPDPFDPNVLPPPAAGEPAEPSVVVAPPAVPRAGGGGGGVSGGVSGGAPGLPVVVVASPS